jgi:hypothetical protein
MFYKPICVERLAEWSPVSMITLDNMIIVEKILTFSICNAKDSITVHSIKRG